jgi:hypothetical protein
MKYLYSSFLCHYFVHTWKIRVTRSPSSVLIGGGYTRHFHWSLPSSFSGLFRPLFKSLQPRMFHLVLSPHKLVGGRPVLDVVVQLGAQVATRSKTPPTFFSRSYLCFVYIKIDERLVHT